LRRTRHAAVGLRDARITPGSHVEQGSYAELVSAGRAPSATASPSCATMSPSSTPPWTNGIDVLDTADVRTHDESEVMVG